MNKKNVLTCAGGGGRLITPFTMAEILLSLTIIGVVAAITLPSLTGNINERTWNTQRKALYARISQAIPLMGSVNGYANAETFVTGGLAKVLKINNICSPDNIKDCGFSSKITKLTASNMELPTKLSELNNALVSVDISETGGWGNQSSFLTDSDAAAFETANGESVLIFYNPNCVSSLGEESSMHGLAQYFYVQPKFCVNLVYDLNGSKGPNTVNKDIGFITIFSPIDSIIVAPYVNSRDTENVNWKGALKACTALDSEYRVPTKYELWSMFVNNELLGLSGHGYDGGVTYWSSTMAVSDYAQGIAWAQNLVNGTYRLRGQDVTFPVRCVKR